uniref:Uncharacterized protein n=1 Tax=Arundo donax TaxID=35708 RepID=A0A0A9BZA8_ARUDO
MHYNLVWFIRKCHIYIYLSNYQIKLQIYLP